MYNKNICLKYNILLDKKMNYCLLRSRILWNKQVMERGIKSSFKSYKSIRHLIGNVDRDRRTYDLRVHWRGLTWRYKLMSFSIRYYLAMELDWSNQEISINRAMFKD